MKRKVQQCSKCNKEISLSNYERHFSGCNGVVKQRIPINHDWKQEDGKYKCPFCNKVYSEKGISTHIWRNHGEGQSHNPNVGYQNDGRQPWNTGLTKEQDDRLRKKGETFSKRYKEGKIKLNGCFTNMTPEIKEKISKSLKIAIKEGRAKGWINSRKDKKPSYPEQFFIKAIENEFNDTDYVREFQIERYFIDFAWVEKKIAIEIDGKQHEFKERKESDLRKDSVLINNGWKVLRIKWTDMFHSPKEWINIAKDFVEK
ncbi:hypothetical protein D3C71_1408210 [compost metagenome]